MAATKAAVTSGSAKSTCRIPTPPRLPRAKATTARPSSQRSCAMLVIRPPRLRKSEPKMKPTSTSVSRSALWRTKSSSKANERRAPAREPKGRSSSGVLTLSPASWLSTSAS